MDVDGYECLRDAIIDGRLHPNERLVEAEVSARFALTASAVRKALIRLEQDGIIERERFRGARVRRLTRRDAEEMLEANAALKAVALRRAVRRATPEQIVMLRRTLERLTELSEGERLLEAGEQTAVLHHQILEVADQTIIRRMSRTLSVHMARFQYQAILLPGGREESLRLQAEIVDGIAAGDEERALDALERHFAHTLRALAAYSERFEHVLLA